MTLEQEQQVDFDLHGIVGIRLFDATVDEVKMITRQVGPIQKELEREPDITIRFVDDLQLSSHVRLLNVNDVGFTDDAFLILRSKHKSKACVEVPFEDIGQRCCNIVAERGLPAIPQLIAIINAVMVSKGILPLHAAAFEYQGVGVLATGWAKGGKTETLLAFAAHGARYVGDEWVYLTGDGEQMYGIPEPIRIWKWHFEELPEYWATLKLSDRLKLNSLSFITKSMERLTDSGVGRRTPPVKLVRRATPILKRQLNVQVPPERLFKDESAGSVVSKPEKIIFVASHTLPDLVVEEADPVEIAKRMVFSLRDERADFISCYTKFRFAFPEARNELIETLEERERELLTSALRGKDAVTFYHPYPVSIPRIYDVLNPLF